MAIGETVITIVGNLTADPELRTTGQGAQVASFTIANTPRQYNRQTGQYEDGDALFLRCSAWNDLAQHCIQSLSKGMRVIAQGRLKQHSYQAQDGANRTVGRAGGRPIVIWGLRQTGSGTGILKEEAMKASEQQVLIPQEATPDTLIDLIGKTQQVTKAAAVVLKACRNVMDTKNKQEHIDKWGGIHAITEAVYDCADLAQRILDAGLAMENMCAKPATSRQMILIDDLRRSLDMEDGDVEASIDPDTGEIG